MDELSPLFHDIEFKERFRGYDVEEVDAYIDRVAKAAALVQGRIAELQNRVSAAESQPREVIASAASAEPLDLDDASVTRMLLLAQRTADTAIEEAHAEAERIRREADEHASLVLAEAETDRRRMQAEAEASVEEAIRNERDRVTAEVAELERYRSFLSDDIAILESHLEQSREALQASVSALQHLVEAPEQFRTPAMPETSGVQVPAELTAEPDVEPEIAEAVVIEAIAADAPLDEHEPEPDLASESAAVLEPTPIVDVDEIVAAAEPVEAVELADDTPPMVAYEPVAVDEVAADEPAADPFDFDFDIEPQGSEVMWAEDAAPSPTFDPGPMPEAVPAPALDAAVVDLTEEPIVLDEVSESPATDFGFHVDEPITSEWSESDTGTHTAIAPPLLVTAADLETPAPEADTDWIDDLRIEAGPVTEPVPTVDDQLLFGDPEPAGSSELFLEQLRDAVSGESSEDFGEDALAAFFDDGEDDGGRTWFNRRR